MLLQFGKSKAIASRKFALAICRAKKRIGWLFSITLFAC